MTAFHGDAGQLSLSWVINVSHFCSATHCHQVASIFIPLSNCYSQKRRRINKIGNWQFWRKRKKIIKIGGGGGVLNPLLLATGGCDPVITASVLLLLTNSSHKYRTATTNIFLPASALEPWEYQTCATPNAFSFFYSWMLVRMIQSGHNAV